MFATYEIESAILDKGIYKYIAGVDEVGRGCLAGPVVAAAVVIPIEHISKLSFTKDSKQLSHSKRAKLYPIIMEYCQVGIGIVENDVIDKINILRATELAMKYAVEQLSKVDYILVDGTVKLKVLQPQQQIIKGDEKSLSIASASIIAKETRDCIIEALHDQFNVYNWKKNKGYGTQEHRDAIAKYGPCHLHRKTFGGVKEYV